MGEANVHQLLLTRFNIRASGAGYRPDRPPGWLEHRYELFVRFCAPSVAAQVEEDFDWLVFCDVETEPAMLDRLAGTDPRIRLIVLPPMGPDPDWLYVRHYARRDAEVVISTRLDNDDGLSRRALRRVREHVPEFLASGHPRAIFNPRFGYKLEVTSGRVFAADMPSNAFLSMLEHAPSAGPLLGAYSANHATMQRRFPTYQEPEERLWLQLVHERNVSNSIRAHDDETTLDALGEDFVVPSADVSARPVG